MKFLIQTLRKDLITKRVIECGLSLKQAAEVSGVSASTICRIEQSKSPDVDTLCKLCEWLGTEPNKYFSIVRPRQEGFRTLNEQLGNKIRGGFAEEP